MQSFYQPLIHDSVYELDKHESAHCLQVLRKRVGDEIIVIDGQGTYFDVLISKIDDGICHFEIQKRRPQLPRSFEAHIAVSPPKSRERLDWMIEKLVEIGADQISFLHCTRSERKSVNLERLKRKAVAALKQSGMAKLPSLSPIYAFSEFLSLYKNEPSKSIAYVNAKSTAHLAERVQGDGTHLVLIGPEGDFTEEEVSAAKKIGYEAVSLGSSRLRTETAAIAACHTIHVANHE